MSFNLGQYGFSDRDRDGQKNDPKPEAEQEAVARIIHHVNPDILAVREIGSARQLADLQKRLKELELGYAFGEYLPTEHSDYNLAVLSRFPILRSIPTIDSVC